MIHLYFIALRPAGVSPLRCAVVRLAATPGRLDVDLSIDCLK
jgi:hypothetical protein